MNIDIYKERYNTMKTIKKIKLHNRSGAALVMVMVIFLFITILLSSVFILGSSNTREVVNQEQGIKSYYIARSGAEAAYQALLTTSPSLLEQFKTDSTAELDNTINFDGNRARH